MNIENLDDDRKIAILNAALKEFSSKGYDDASTNNIAKDAGISKALMFHYVGNKKELFLFVYDYFNRMLEENYFLKMNFSEKDLFTRLRQNYFLQIQLLKQFPYIFDFYKLTNPTKSEELNLAIQNRNHKLHGSCDQQIFEDIDISKFKSELTIEKCQQFIQWSNVGFTNQLLKEIRTTKEAVLDYEKLMTTLDDYFAELRKIFYK